jgi:uncharacterized surface protein with fasciclin (FAS1) repeats
VKKSLVIISAVAASAALAGFASAGSSNPTSSASQANIVQTAASAGQFTTLISLAKKAGLAGALQSKKLTVFAPTDAAFAKVPKKTLNALAKDRKALRSVLLYHVVAGKVPAAKVVKISSAKTLQGSTVKITVKGGKVFVNKARVISPDVKASNGIIHVINQVLLPPAR